MTRERSRALEPMKSRKPRKAPRRGYDMGLSRKVERALVLMVWGAEDGGKPLDREAAAQAVSLAPDSLRKAFLNPQVRGRWNELCQMMRDGLRPEAIGTIATLMRGASSEKVKLDAAKHFDPVEKGAGVTVNVNQFNAEPAPGYLVDISEFPTEQLDELERRALIGGNPPPRPRQSERIEVPRMTVIEGKAR